MESYQEKHDSSHAAKFWRENNRDTYTCPDCSRGVDEVVRFEVHHIDGDVTNGNDDNLIGLCRACHYHRHDAKPPESLDDWKERARRL